MGPCNNNQNKYFSEFISFLDKELKETEGLIDQMAKTYLKPLEIPSHLFITAHDTIRPYS